MAALISKYCAIIGVRRAAALSAFGLSLAASIGASLANRRVKRRAKVRRIHGSLGPQAAGAGAVAPPRSRAFIALAAIV